MRLRDGFSVVLEGSLKIGKLRYLFRGVLQDVGKYPLAL